MNRLTTALTGESGVISTATTDILEPTETEEMGNTPRFFVVQAFELEADWVYSAEAEEGLAQAEAELSRGEVSSFPDAQSAINYLRSQ